MADIKQAARWLQEGLVVRRNSEDADPTVRYKYDGDWFVADEGDDEFEQGTITLSDILAEDWEILE